MKADFVTTLTMRTLASTVTMAMSETPGVVMVMVSVPPPCLAHASLTHRPRCHHL